MYGASLGAGLAALAFWGFVSVCVIAGIWDSARKRETRHETIRRVIESGQEIDSEMLDKLLGNGMKTDQALMLGGLVCLFLAPGLAVFGWLIGLQWHPAFLPILGSAVLVALVAAGLIVAARMLRQENPAPSVRLK